MQTSEHLDQLLKDSKKQALKFIAAQFVMTALLSVLMLPFSWVAFYSALTGGLIASLANGWFALKVFRVDRVEQPGTLLTAFYVGEIYKFLLTASLFIMAFVLIKPINIIVLMSIFFLVHLTPAVVNVFGPVNKHQ